MFGLMYDWLSESLWKLVGGTIYVVKMIRWQRICIGKKDWWAFGGDTPADFLATLVRGRSGYSFTGSLGLGGRCKFSGCRGLTSPRISLDLPNWPPQGKRYDYTQTPTAVESRKRSFL